MGRFPFQNGAKFVIVMDFTNASWVGHPPDFQAILRPELFNNGNPREEPFSFSVSSIYLLFPWLEAEPF